MSPAQTGHHRKGERLYAFPPEVCPPLKKDNNSLLEILTHSEGTVLM